MKPGAVNGFRNIFRFGIQTFWRRAKPTQTQDKDCRVTVFTMPPAFRFGVS